MIRLAVRCRPELAERVLAELVELAPGGVEETSGSEWVEYAVYGVPGELPALPGIQAAVGEGVADISTSEIPDDWADRWQDFHQPVLVGGRLWVRPSWEAPREGAIDVVVDPGRAFGTGAHATTRMCLELLLGLAEAGRVAGPIADWGTGSGVLAKLGFEPVLACDQEPAALEAASQNAAANGVEIDLRRVDLRERAAPAAPTAIANLTAPILGEVAERLDSAPDRLICSGLTEDEVDGTRAAFARRHLAPRQTLVRSGWVAMLLAAEQTGDEAPA